MTNVEVVRDKDPRPLSVCLINPKFVPSFWGYEHALALMPGDRRCSMATGALPALAALVPYPHSVELLDENVDPIDFEALRRFDVIGVTGMIVQGPRMLEILRRLKELPATIVVGGPYASVAEEVFAGLCDVLFVGEAEDTWPGFLDRLSRGGQVSSRYEQTQKTDMRTVPAPRYDLMNPGRYLMASLQFSRGCPFTCEFCDIITIFGRRPRLKSIEQMIEEFDGIRRAGFRACFLVDDNLIGNKGEAKKLLTALARWQQENNYPVQINAEASINLAEDQEMIDLMVEANVTQIFIGIESPRRDSLIETKKIQNVRGESLLTKIRRIRDGGLIIRAGFMVGFDADDEAIFQDQFDFIQEAGIANAMVSLLTPIPTTPLYDRLAAAGRLDFSDPRVPFLPLRMDRETLKAGYDDLLQRLYEPEAYFDRVFAGYAGSPAFRARRREVDRRAAGHRGFSRRMAQVAGALLQVSRLWYAAVRGGHAGRLGSAYLKAWMRLNRPLGRERISFPAFVSLCVAHWHTFKIANSVGKHNFGVVQSLPVALPTKPAAKAA